MPSSTDAPVVYRPFRFEAPLIHAVLTQALAGPLLPFTVYRAPQSVARVATLAGEGRVRVVGRVDGVAITTEDHLDYLAVADRVRGQGLGTLLLEDFHARRPHTTLDVFADNPARPLYERMGYVARSESLSLRLALRKTGYPPDTWRVALREEKASGFAAVTHMGMRIGLLGGTALRLIGPGSRTVEEALEILARIGFAGRNEMVLTGLREIPKGYDVIQRARNLRMERNG